MRVGVIFPQTEIGSDPVAVKDYAQAAEALGFTHLVAFDHVLGANRASRPDWNPPYDHTKAFHEPFVLFGYLAGLTPALEFATGVIILPQRQTALAAKQAAEVALLTGGRFRFGIGLGWNHVEYEALGQDFHTRGDRIEEQVALMRELWANDLVTFKGRWDTVTDAGLNPLPPQGSIPLWFGGNDDRALRRIAKIGDGWFPIFAPGAKGEERLERLRAYLREAGREPAGFGIDGMIQGGARSPEEWARDAEWWRANGATHCSLNTMAGGRQGADAHIAAIRQFREHVPLAA